MPTFLDWFNKDVGIDLVLKAALVTLWFVTLHPFMTHQGDRPERWPI